MTLIDQFSTYQRGRGFSPHTVQRRKGTLTSFSKFLAPKHLDRATLVDVEEFLACYASPRTRHAFRSDLRVFYRWAVSRELLTSNPTELVDPIKLPKALPRPIGPEVHVAILTAAPRTRIMMALGLYAGLRNSEIATLAAEDIAVHHDPPLITIRNGKGGKDRIIPMHPALVDLMGGIPRDGPLFPNPLTGRAIRPNSVWRTIRMQFLRCGIDATPHQLRHTFGTEMARAAKGNLLAVANVMGHSSMNTTRGYVGWSGESASIIATMYRSAAVA